MSWGGAGIDVLSPQSKTTNTCHKLKKGIVGNCRLHGRDLIGFRGFIVVIAKYKIYQKAAIFFHRAW